VLTLAAIGPAAGRLLERRPIVLTLDLVAGALFVVLGCDAALLASAERVDANAPLLQRLAMFARLHPTTLASAGLAAVLMIGPRRLLRVVRGSLPTLLPMLLKLKR
jgi:hypothetical protein